MSIQKRTLGELRAVISARLGFGASGAATGINQTLIDSFLQDAQTQLYWQYEWRSLIKYDEKTTGVGQTLYDWATDCDPERILSIAVKINGLWQPMAEGIDWDMRSVSDSQSFPVRYERYAQMEVYPEPDQAYTMRRYYVQALGRFTQDNDRATIDDGLVFLHALANAKAHYRQPDAGSYANQLQALLSKLKGKNASSAVRNRKTSGEILPLPKVV